MGKKKTTVMSNEVENVTKTKTKKVTKKSEKVAPEISLETPDNLPTMEAISSESSSQESPEVKKEKRVAVRSKRYVVNRAMVDRTHLYTPEEAVALAKKTHYGKFAGSLEANLMLRDENMSADVAFPYSTGKAVKVAIATDELLADVEKGKIEFTILVAHPSMMPKLAKLARVLGPKGLMPNPKNGTISPDPEKRAKELAGGSTTVKTEKKAPLVHVSVGKLSQPDEELVANLRALLKAFPSGKVTKCVISASMGPGVKVVVS